MTYRNHVFVCTNERDNEVCCVRRGAWDVLKHMKRAVRDAGLDRPGGVWVNCSGCFNHCDAGPNVVVYPEGIWYRLERADQVERVLKEHLVEGHPVIDLVNTEIDS